jgi:NADH-quinone oxidoreductase subunit H
MSPYLPILIEALVKIIAIIAVVMTGVAYTTLAERKVSAWMQDRKGPNRVGPFGLLQPVADGVKFFFKEDITPREAVKGFYLAAPMLTFIPALAAFAVVPFGTSVSFGEKSYTLSISSMNVGILYLLALSSLGVYGILLAGWSSGNKYSLMGSLRGASQVISYELGISLALLTVVMAAGSFDLRAIVDSQKTGHLWNFLPHFLGFTVFLVSVFAETNRIPFDLPEGESEIVGGYHTEYSGLRFAMFFMGEYANMITASAFVTCLFLGGWHLPFLDYDALARAGYATLGGVISMAVFGIKVAFCLFVFIWVRWTLPRFRYDQLMSIGWKRLFPLALLNLVLFSTWLVFGVR